MGRKLTRGASVKLYGKYQMFRALYDLTCRRPRIAKRWKSAVVCFQHLFICWLWCFIYPGDRGHAGFAELLLACFMRPGWEQSYAYETNFIAGCIVFSISQILYTKYTNLVVAHLDLLKTCLENKTVKISLIFTIVYYLTALFKCQSKS